MAVVTLRQSLLGKRKAWADEIILYWMRHGISGCLVRFQWRNVE